MITVGRQRQGFTLIEVMIALAILGMSLVILVKSVAGNATAATDSFYMGVATDLARGKMYDLEEQLLAEGFQDAEQEEEGDFGEEGWRAITWKATIEPVELPSYDKLMGGQRGAGAGSGDGAGAGDGSDDGSPDPAALDKFQSSALGAMVGMIGGGGGGDDGPDSVGEARSGAFIQGQYTLIQQVLKASIRKITLTVAWNAGLHPESVKIILYVTDPAGMQKTLGGLGI